MAQTLKYRHEDDRCYGATGMAIGLVIFDGERMLDHISVDAEPDEMVALTNDFYFSGNPSISAKTAWNRILTNFNLMSAMVISNVMSRYIVLDGSNVSREMKKLISDIVESEADETCSLEHDEVQHLFEKNYKYLDNVFHHSGVQSIAHEFASYLKTHRSMTRNEVLEHLHALGML